ncbi:hypothetical protein C8R47DRAFT_1080237 [Mycena vitilis]|nr:hypothetical protein C8R47DRAFT_1080237 [Mycena vitilis]
MSFPSAALSATTVYNVVQEHRTSMLSALLPPELWSDIFRKSVVDAMVDSRANAQGRAKLCALSRETRFVLGRLSYSATIEVKFTIGDLPWALRNDLPSLVYGKIDALLAILLPLAIRWESFSLVTEHPAIFQHFRVACSDVKAPALRSISLHYRYMPDYSVFDISLPTDFELPFVSGPWFRNKCPSLIRLALKGSGLLWRAPELFAGLTEVDLHQMESACNISWPIFDAIFQAATSLLTLRIGEIKPFHIPHNAILSSPTLITFDVTICTRYSVSHIAELLGSFAFPGLRVLVARSIAWTNFVPLMRFSRNLLGVTDFELHGDCRNGDGLHGLFGLMPSLSSLDLSNARGLAFSAFLEWSVAVCTFSNAFINPVEMATLASALRMGYIIFLLPVVGDIRARGSILIPSATLLSDRGHLRGALQGFSTTQHKVLSLLSSVSDWRRAAAMSLVGCSSEPSDVSLYPVGLLPSVPVPTLPQEIVNMVLGLTAEHANWDDIYGFLHNRTTLQMLSQSYYVYINQQAVFADHILLTPETAPVLSNAVAAAGTFPLHLTVRIPSALAPSPGSSVCQDYHTVCIAYLAVIATYVEPLVPRCAGLTIQGPGSSKVAMFLRFICSAKPTILEYLAISFDVVTLADFSNGTLTFDGFSTDPPFGPVFNRYHHLTIKPTTGALSRCAQISRATTCSTLYQSDGDPLLWSHFIGILYTIGQYKSVSLHNIRFVSDPGSIRACRPITSITTLSLTFDGNLEMARVVSCLMLPNLNTLVVHLVERRDWHCVSVCGAFLATVGTLGVVTPSDMLSPPDGHSFYSLLHGVRRLDLRRASPSLFACLIKASSIVLDASLSFATNWNACPNLSHVDVGRVDFDLFRQLIAMRVHAGYLPLVTASLHHSVGGSSLIVDDWFLQQMIKRVPYESHFQYKYERSGVNSHNLSVMNPLAPSPLLYKPDSYMYHALLTDPTTSPVSSAALEVLLEILLLACGDYIGSRATFLAARGACMLVCREWREAIVNCGAFWSSYIFRPLRDRATFDLWTSRFRGHSLNLVIDLDQRVLWTAAEPGQMSVEDMLSAMLFFLPFCRSLTVEAADVVVLTALTTTLSNVTMPRLRYLAMVSGSFSSLVSLSTVYYPGLIPAGVVHHAAFVPPSPGPAFIRLSGLVLTWTSHFYYSNVTTLILQYFAEPVAPTITDLHLLLRAAVSVRRLSLNGICCKQSSSMLDPLQMDKLEELQLRIAGNPSLGRLIMCMRAPSLRVFHVVMDGSYDLHCLIRSGPLLAKVTSLVLDGDLMRGYPVADFLTVLPSVTHCDMSMSCLDFFRALIKGGNRLFPALNSLVISDIKFSELKQFLGSRRAVEDAPVPVLTVLYIRSLYGCRFDAKELAWIRGQVGTLDLDPAWDNFWYEEL